MAARTKFYCNISALNPAERMHHKQLTEKLIAARKQTVETQKGYEFRYSPSNVSLAERPEWVAAESKCCPFFDFRIDLEREGSAMPSTDRRGRNQAVYPGPSSICRRNNEVGVRASFAPRRE